jgi:cell shape-determining protein MreC
MPSPAEVYRQNAAACNQLAERATDALAKQTFRKSAEAWLNLAALAEGQEKSEWCNAAIISGRRNVR